MCCGCNIYWSNLLSPALSVPVSRGGKDAPVTKASLSANPFTFKERNKRKWLIKCDLQSEKILVTLNGILHSMLNRAAVKESRISRHMLVNTPTGQVMYAQHLIIISSFSV